MPNGVDRTRPRAAIIARAKLDRSDEGLVSEAEMLGTKNTSSTK
jgi:hypothetical protein